jgi:hypothetical protein
MRLLIQHKIVVRLKRHLLQRGGTFSEAAAPEKLPWEPPQRSDSPTYNLLNVEVRSRSGSF